MAFFNPKTEAEKGLHVILSWGLMIGAVYYLLTTFDFIPDFTIWGFIDDIIIILLAYWAFRQVTSSVKTKGTTAFKNFVKYFNEHSMVEMFGTLKFWGTIVLVGFSIWYFTWTLDFIPDPTPGIGFFDDGIVIISSLTALIKMYSERSKTK